MEERKEESNKAIFAGTVTVADPQTGDPIELEIWKDPCSHGLFAIDASFLDQVSDTIRSPFNEKVMLVLGEGALHNKTTAIKQAFNNEEMTTILEAANTALADADIFDHLAEQMDVADEHMQAIREKLHAFLNGQPPKKAEYPLFDKKEE